LLKIKLGDEKGQEPFILYPALAVEDGLILIINASPGSVLQELFVGAGIEADSPPLTVPLPIKVAFSALYHS
jgi:hypothetical protein